MSRIFVISQKGKPLMPTKSFGKVRYWLKNNLATVIQRKPLVIKLCFEVNEDLQSITLAVDSGYNHIGFSLVTGKEEVLAGEVQLLQGMKERLTERASYRRTRRSRLRYRKPGFNDNKKDGWLAPSIQHKLDSHIRFIDKLHRYVPISKIILEVANFDIQKINNPEISGIEYQMGEQFDFWNLREYILHRDEHKCQNKDCKNKDKQQILVLHHIVFRSNGGDDSPKNLITLCHQCHTPVNHRGFLKDWKPKIPSFRGATFMSMVRWKMIDVLKMKYPNMEYTYGYMTKSKRIELQISKSHINDAFVIANGQQQNRTTPYLIKQRRRNNRSIKTFYDAKYMDSRDSSKKAGKELFCGRTTRNKEMNGENLKKYRGHKISKGRYQEREIRSNYQPGDIVKYNWVEYVVVGSQNKGAYIKLEGLKKVPSVRNIQMISYGKSFSFTNSKVS
jgi:hypothetical protein